MIGDMKTDRRERKVFTNTQASKRRSLHAPLIVLRSNDQSKRKVFFGYAKNLSMGGMFIASINPPSPGKKFCIEFAIPGSGQNVKCTGEVVWNRTYSNRGKYEPGMGMRFLDIPHDTASAIDEWANATDKQARAALDATPAPI